MKKLEASKIIPKHITMHEAFTTEEKIDYIYNTLRKNQRWATIGIIFKWSFRLAILWYLYYFLTVGVPTMIDKIVPKFPSIWWEQAIDAEKIKELMSIPHIKEALDSYINK